LFIVTESGPSARAAEAHELERGYRLAARGREAAEDERLSLLEQLYDPTSRRRRSLVQPGWRCLEIGAGRGSMAVWLAEQVGPTGQVVATDIDTRYLQRLDVPNLEALEHNILEDSLDVLGPGSFDLVCSRLMLFHLVGTQELAIRQMVECLRPGGWLIDEDADWGTAAPVDPAHPRYDAYRAAWQDGDWWTARGYDKAFGQKLPPLFERCGLREIRHEAATEVVRGGSPWARWWTVTLEVMNELGGGVTESDRRELETIAAALADPTVWLMKELLHACWGRRAGDTGV
jgi:SAM-dependent methyltransferase